MSYDVVAFETDAPPDGDFDAWYSSGAAWADEDDTEDPSTASPRLRSFCEALWEQFPAMNDTRSPTGEGAQQVSRALADLLADYSYGAALVHVAFADASARPALQACATAAARAGVALALISAGSPAPVLEPPA